MLNLGFTEIILISVVAIIVVGPERLPTLLGWMGRQYGRLKGASEELRQAFVVEAERVEADKRTEILRRRREEARKRIEAARAQAAMDSSTPIPRTNTGVTPNIAAPTQTADPEANQAPPAAQVDDAQPTEDNTP